MITLGGSGNGNPGSVGSSSMPNTTNVAASSSESVRSKEYYVKVPKLVSYSLLSFCCDYHCKIFNKLGLKGLKKSIMYSNSTHLEPTYQTGIK